MNETLDNSQMVEKEDNSIDYGKIFQDLLKRKKLFYKVLPITFFMAYIGVGWQRYLLCL